MFQILIVEDSPTQADLLQTTLEEAGFSVLLAADGESALEVVANRTVDLVISDIVMPGMTGYELCRHIKNDRDHGPLPVMLLSSLNEPMDIIRGLESGADNFLTKPYKPEQLVARARTILQNRALRNRAAVFGVEIAFLGKTFTITSEKEQILDLLISTFEDTVQANRELQRHRAELAAAKIKLEEYATALEGRVRLSEEKFRGFLTASPDALIVVDQEQRIVLASERTQAIFGYTPEELTGRPYELLVPDSAAENGPVAQRYGRRKDGSAFPIETTLSVHRTPEGAVAITAIRDVTERLQMEDQLRHSQRIDAMGQLTGGLAHDFNNLLGVIVGNLDVIAARKIDAIEPFVANALEAADRGRPRPAIAGVRAAPTAPARADQRPRTLARDRTPDRERPRREHHHQAARRSANPADRRRPHATGGRYHQPCRQRPRRDARRRNPDDRVHERRPRRNVREHPRRRAAGAVRADLRIRYRHRDERRNAG